MTVVQRLARRNLVLGILAVILVLVLVLRPSPTSALRTSELPKLFPELEAAAARTIVLERIPAPDAEDPTPTAIRLARSGDAAWQVESRDGYPASEERVRAFLEALEGAREKKVVTQRADTFDEYAGPDGWTRVQVLDAAEVPLAAFELGKSAGWPDSYLKMDVDGAEKVVRAHNLTGDKLGLQVDQWVEARLWPHLSLPLVTGIDVFQRPMKRTLSFKRQAPAEGDDPSATSGWKMVAPKTEMAETTAVEGLVRAFTGMRLDDVRDIAVGPEAEARLGLDKPTYRIVVYAEEGDKAESKYVLEIGKPAKGDLESPEAWYVRRSGDTWALEVPQYAIAEFERLPEDFLPQPEDEEAPTPPNDPTVPADPTQPVDPTVPTDSAEPAAPPADETAAGDPDGG